MKGYTVNVVQLKLLVIMIGSFLLVGCSSTPMKDLKPSEIIQKQVSKYEKMKSPDSLTGWEKGLWFYKHKQYDKALSLLNPHKDKNIAEVEHAYGYMNHRFKQDYKTAASWYKKAIKNGNHATSLNNLSIMYANGLGVEQDTSKAMDLLIKSAKGGYVPAQFSLGKAYYIGEKISLDYGKAYYWLQQAYYNGHVRAPYTIGDMYESGYGFKEDKQKALYWFNEAQKRGSQWGADGVERIKRVYGLTL